MHLSRLPEYVGGWFLGDFTPTLERNPHVEVCVKRYAAGTIEAVHYQRISTEHTLIISGLCRLGGVELGPDDIATIPPGEPAGFEALTDVILVAVKMPSLPDDKFFGEPA